MKVGVGAAAQPPSDMKGAFQFLREFIMALNQKSEKGFENAKSL
jgi:hypothetical protein